ncbi:hypothetical protein [Vibrio spartinae]|uniref:Terminase small subunit n=1 Tax=Vibrio spartinae TaxID=1918945 RepID=A0A1N6M9J8_9VIBR|nr:hypothetical protein [Vibrio spartinae]SIO96073.1 hypothetical protein VSP9026_03831 [Vibrio spartinae]
MAKHDWNALQRQFEHDHAKYGTGAKEWCEAKGLNYASARRYIKVRKAAQSAQKKSAHNDNAQSALSQPKAGQNQRREKSELPKTYENTQLSPPEIGNHNLDGERDEKGRFKAGHSQSVGNSGNLHPEYSFEPGNQLRRKSGMYARYLPPSALEMFEVSETATLEDELALTRVRLQMGLEYLKQIMADLQSAPSAEVRASLYESYAKAQTNLDVLTSRIESITNTISKLGLDVVGRKKIVADTGRIENASRKLSLEADAIQSAGKADETPMSEMLSDIRSMSRSGLMSDE